MPTRAVGGGLQDLSAGGAAAAAIFSGASAAGDVTTAAAAAAAAAGALPCPPRPRGRARESSGSRPAGRGQRREPAVGAHCSREPGRGRAASV